MTATFMHLTDSHLELRARAQEFLSDHWSTVEQRAGSTETFRRTAIDAGLLYRWVPKAYGGAEMDSDVISEAIIDAEFRAVQAPGELDSIGARMVVPTLLEHANPALCKAFAGPTIVGQIRWCQGYSEPGVGSDLASVTTRATATDDRYWRIDGRKIWTSYAADADYVFVLARTDAADRGHDGLSYILVPMDQPGVRVEPIRQITGAATFNEVIFDDARTPLDHVVGEPGNGWTVATTTLRHERTMISGAGRLGTLFRALLRAYAARGAPHDPALAQRLMELRELVEVKRFATIEQAFGTAQDLTVLRLTDKLFQSAFQEKVAALAMDLLPSVAADLPRTEVVEARWVTQILGSLGLTIAGGTSNIQRDILARRGLGMPEQRRADQ